MSYRTSSLTIYAFGAPAAAVIGLLLMAMAAGATTGCSAAVTSRCWGDSMGVNFCTHFVQQHFWTGAVAITDARYPARSDGLSISDQLSTTTGIASTLGGSIVGEVAQHVVVAP